MTIPAAPSALTATPLTASRIDLAWTDNSSDEANFELERSPNGTTGWTLIASPVADAVSYSNTGLAANTTYYYRIRAVNGDGNSAYSNVASALTLLPGSTPLTPRLFLLSPTVVFAARVNLPDPADYPISFVAFDGVTVGAYTDIKPGMTLLLGSATGLDDYGRQRVRKDATTISIFVGRSSRGTHDGELTLVDDAYITVLNDYRVWAKIPFIDSTGGIFKDSDLEVGDRTTTPPPVAVMGQGFAATVDPDTEVITVLFNGQNSYATSDGATITDYLWDIGDGTLTSGTVADDNVTIEFPAGFRYVSLTVTDSNGKTHTSYRPVFADDVEHTLSFDAFQIESHRITDAGQSLSIGILEDMPRTTYPDGTLAMIWLREPSGAANRDHMLIIGWLDTEDNRMGAGRLGLLRDTTLTIQDVGQRLDTLPGFPQSLADDDTRLLSAAVLAKIPDITWNYMVAPTMDKYMHYLLQWHSTALEVADFIWSDTGTAYRIAIKNSDGESLWNQVQRTAQAMCPGYALTCDQAGRIQVVPDPQLQDSADRTAAVQAAIDENEWSDIRFTYQRAPRVHWLRTGALVAQPAITFNADGTVYLPTVFAIAPGDTPGQGLGEVENNEQLAASQAVLNSATGHKYARLNAPVPTVTVQLTQDDSVPTSALPWREIEPATKEWVTLTVSSLTAARRGLTWTAIRALPKEVSIRYEHGKAGLTRTLDLTLELETSGETAATVVKPTVPAVGDDPVVLPDPIPPPDMGLISGQELVAGIGETSVYRTADFQTVSGSGGPTWEEEALTADTTLTWVVDPFSPGYLTGTGAINGWRATTTKIYRITDLFGTVGETAIVTFANTALWRTIQASFGTYFVEGSNPWLLCVSYYGDLAGHTGTWATYSQDGGVTWSTEVQITAHYDSGGAVQPIAVYTSPKTPGLAYTFAYTATADPAPASGYYSPTWGASWAANALLDPGVGLGGDIHVPWLAAGDDTIYHGHMAAGAAEDPAEPWVHFAIYDATANTVVDEFLGRRASATVSASSPGGGVNVTSNAIKILFAPAAEVKRIKFDCVYEQTYVTDNGTFTSQTTTFTQREIVGQPAEVTTLSLGSMPSGGGTIFDIFTTEWTRASGATDWSGTRALMEANLPTLSNWTSFYRWDLAVSAQGIGVHTPSNTLSFEVAIAEIELDTGEIYTPTSDARSFFLRRVNADNSVDDVSPSSGDIPVSFGPNAYSFRIRAHDSDDTLLLAAVTGNDVSGLEADDTQAVFTSSDTAATWTEIVAPVTSTDPFAAAWSGSLDGIVYIWGPAEYFGYSSDSGATIDDRSGNLAALSATAIRGIAGGPVTP